MNKEDRVSQDREWNREKIRRHKENVNILTGVWRGVSYLIGKKYGKERGKRKGAIYER